MVTEVAGTGALPGGTGFTVVELTPGRYAALLRSPGHHARGDRAGDGCRGRRRGFRPGGLRPCGFGRRGHGPNGNRARRDDDGYRHGRRGDGGQWSRRRLGAGGRRCAPELHARHDPGVPGQLNTVGRLRPSPEPTQFRQTRRFEVRRARRRPSRSRRPRCSSSSPVPRSSTQAGPTHGDPTDTTGTVFAPPSCRAACYDALVPVFVLTVIGEDRVGLVEALAETVSSHGGNWEHSQMAELAGKFAGIVVVTVPADRVTDLSGALRGLDGLLEVSAHPGTDAAADQRSWPQLTLDLIGNDRPGIVHEVSAVLSRHGLSIETMTTDARDAPMAGGMIFEAHVVARLPPSSDLPPCVPTSRSWQPSSWSTSAPARRRGEFVYGPHNRARGGAESKARPHAGSRTAFAERSAWSVLAVASANTRRSAAGSRPRARRRMSDSGAPDLPSFSTRRQLIAVTASTTHDAPERSHRTSSPPPAQREPIGIDACPPFGGPRGRLVGGRLRRASSDDCGGNLGTVS